MIEDNQKGFTLVETLGVIVILSIIMLIAVPAITASTGQMSSSYYQNLEKLVLISAKDYYRDNRSLYPNQLGRKSTVGIDHLVKLKYMEQPKSTKKNDCIGYVEVSMEDKIQWKTCLKCDNYESDATCDFEHTTTGSNVESSTGSKTRYLFLTQTEYTVVRGNPFTPPFAELRYGDATNYEILRSDIGAIPGYVDTSRIGDYTINYAFAGTTPIPVIVHVVDVTPPSAVEVVMREDGMSGTIYTSGWTNHDIYQIFHATDDDGGSGLKGYEYSLENQPNNNGSWTLIHGSYITQKELLENLGTASLDFNQTVYVRAVDNHDNRGPVASYTLSVDQTPPSCTSSGGVENWVKEQTISGSCSDTGSGCVGDIHFEIPNTSNDFMSPGDIYDIAGNKTTCPSVSVKVDKEPPSEVVVSFNGGGNTCSFKNDYDIRLSATDSHSGMAYYEVDVNEDGQSDFTSDGHFVPENGFSSHNVSFRAVDQAGNRGPWSSGVHIHQDTEKPVMTEVRLSTEDGGSYTSGTWTNKRVKITGIASDNIRVQGYLYSTDQVTWNPLNDSVFFENINTTIYVKAVDQASNVSDNQKEVVISSDTTPPTIIVSEESSSHMKFVIDDVHFSSLSLTVSKDSVVDDSKTVSNHTSKEISVSFDDAGDWTVHVVAVDIAGNIVEQDFHKIISTS